MPIPSSPIIDAIRERGWRVTYTALPFLGFLVLVGVPGGGLGSVAIRLDHTPEHLDAAVLRAAVLATRGSVPDWLAALVEQHQAPAQPEPVPVPASGPAVLPDGYLAGRIEVLRERCAVAGWPEAVADRLVRCVETEFSGGEA
jgi:hypothetical protein